MKLSDCVDHLSPSSIGMYIDQPAAWVMRYLFKVRDEAGPAASRGHAVQKACEIWMHGEDFETAAAHGEREFGLLTGGQADLGHEDEKALIRPMLLQVTKLIPQKYPVNVEHRVEVKVDGLEVPIIGFIDWLMPDKIVDLKTVKAMPSKPKMNHMRQVSLYSKAMSLPSSLLYVTKAKGSLYALTEGELEAQWKSLCMAARSIQNLIQKSETKEEAASFFVPDYEHFYWDTKTIEAGKQIWKE